MSSLWMLTFMLTLSAHIPTTTSQDYFSSIAQMKALPYLQQIILNKLEAVVDRLKTDLRIINETSTRLREIKVTKSKAVVGNIGATHDGLMGVIFIRFHTSQRVLSPRSISSLRLATHYQLFSTQQPSIKVDQHINKFKKNVENCRGIH
ncbi:hypothetical protein M8J77_018256 [Diaphorina citri]|nr:hypothetical protein M8J77_018256 [Diaphorina citri]